MGKVFMAQGRGRPTLHDYEPQHAWGIATPCSVNAWLGPEEPTSIVGQFIPSKQKLNALSEKFALAESKRKVGGLP